MNLFRITQAQLTVSTDTDGLFEKIKRAAEQAVREESDLLTLPEMFCCPYDINCFSAYAEEEGGPIWRKCSETARSFGIALSAGTVPEADPDGNIYNTAYVFDRNGTQIAKHRKMHLFDINVKGGQQFRESSVLSPGSSVTVFEAGKVRMGLAVCYDIRFPELFRLMALDGARVILVPAAFNLTTGPMHWELLFRSQAMANQVFIAGTAPARDTGASYVSWGHSIVTGPWGEIISQTEESPCVRTVCLDLEQCDRVREQIPLLRHRRTDLYELSLNSYPDIHR